MLWARRVVVHNASYDRRVWDTAVRRLGTRAALAGELAPWECAMRAFAAYVGERSKMGGYKNQKLPGGDHTALAQRARAGEQGKGLLVHVLLEQALEDERLYGRLLTWAARARPEGVNLAALRKVIDDAFYGGDTPDHGSAERFARGIVEVVRSIAELQREGHAREFGVRLRPNEEVFGVRQPEPPENPLISISFVGSPGERRFSSFR